MAGRFTLRSPDFASHRSLKPTNHKASSGRLSSSSSFRLRPRPGSGTRLAREADFERSTIQSLGFVGQAVLESWRAE
jgi:hypothetical protein